MSRIFLVAGEISGDLLGAALIRELRRQIPGLEVRGIGGDALAAEGMRILRPVRDMAVLGFSEVVRRLPFFHRVFNETLADIRRDPPDAVILVDYPGFNMKLARALHGLGPRIIYYVCPQVWAWHRSRIARLAQDVDRLLVLFPFEAEVFAGTGLKVDFIGHPLVDVAAAALAGPAQIPQPWPAPEHIAILPGSRRQEIARVLPPLLAAAAALEQQRPGAGFLIAAASPESAAHIERILPAVPRRPERLRVVEGHTRAILAQARAGWVCSGTATIEAALMNCPHVVVYRTAAVTYWVGRRLVRVPHLGMVNLVAGREICPERLQEAMTPAALCAALHPLLDETPERTRALAGLEEVRARLGGGGAAQRAAQSVKEELRDAGLLSADRVLS